MSNVKHFNPKPSGNHQKKIERLRFDPLFTEIQLRAIKDPENKKKYADEVRKKFNLSPAWSRMLEWYLYYPEMVFPMTGSSTNSYMDEVTGKEFHVIFVDPDTTIDNVKSSYKRIKAGYKEAGMSKGLRKLRRKDLTPIHIAAYRLSENGLSDKEILASLEGLFPNEVIELHEISLFKREGKNKLAT